jgi:hypothetical protein
MAARLQMCVPYFRMSVRVLGVSAAIAAFGCAGNSSQPTQSGPSERDLRGVSAAERSVQADGAPRVAATAERRVATAAGAAVLLQDLDAALLEAAGAQALQELTLDRMLRVQMRTRGWELAAEDIARERRLIEETISRDARVETEDTERLLAAVRRNRGLGPVRFERLLERTAMMRRLVADEVEIEESELHQAYEMKHGPRYLVRVIMTAQDREAARLHQELSEMASEQRRIVFADRAARLSLDPSAQRGGLLEPLSPADPAYPAALRSALQRLAPGDVSPVIAVDRGYAILLLEEILPADSVAFEAAAGEIERQVRLRRERLAMDDLARRLLREAQITVFDSSLGWSWQNSAAPSSP